MSFDPVAFPEAVLACPRCQRVIEAQEAAFRCKACKVDYPVIGGVPWLFAVPSAVLSEWRTRFARELQAMDLEVARAAAAVRDQPTLRETTRQRLARTASGFAARAADLRMLLEPLGKPAEEMPHEVLLALRTRLPPSQGLTTYSQNAFRDWSWGDDENLESASMVASHLPDDPETLLVLGSGAGRLAYDLHQLGMQAWTLGLDLNPLLTFIGDRVSRGEVLELYEFPLAPRRMEDIAVKRTLKAPERTRDGLAFLLGDILSAPLRPGSIDVIVAPWFVDIVDIDFAILARHLAQLLKPDGQLVLFGSLTFSSAEPALRYSFEEVEAILEEAGFGATSVEERSIPYLCSPSSRHGRRERVVTLGARKVREVKAPPKPAALPDWLVAGRETVPLTEAFQYQIAATRIHAFIMSLIDGKRSIRDMAQLMEEQGLMPRKDAEEAVRQFLITMWNESRQSDY
ncbi:MAG: methyltransferase domain-containing protein [Pseudomonadales bacterium]|nr:methyltransferase domain-containing protein [Pseudomonadales bacterium]